MGDSDMRPSWYLPAIALATIGMIAGATAALLAAAAAEPRAGVVVAGGVVLVASVASFVFQLVDFRRRYWTALGVADQPAARRALQDAARHGRVPDDPALHAPLREMVRRQRSALRWQWIAFPLYVLVALFNLFEAVTGGRPLRWAMTAVFVVVAVLGVAGARTGARKMDRLSVALDGAGGPGPR